MTRIAVFILPLLLWIGLTNICFAEAPPATGPKVLDAPPRVVVYPFTPVGDPGAYAWVGNGIQQSLLVDVGRPGFVAMIVPSTQPNEAGADPVATAARAGAAVAVFGSYQILNGDIRCTGQVVDTGTGQAIGALSATGQLRELFKIEDELGRQLRRALQPSTAMAPRDQTASQPQDSYPPVASSTSGYYYSGSGDSYVPSTYYVPSYSYAYPSYDYGYPYYPYYSSYYPFTTSIFIGSSRFGHSHRFEHRDFDGDDRSFRFHNGGFDRGGFGRGGFDHGRFDHGGFVASGSFGGFAGRAPFTRFNGGVGGGFRGPSTFGGGRAPVMQNPGMFHTAGGGGFGGRAPMMGGSFGGGRGGGMGGGGGHR
jgi:TolB-like protein